MLYLILTKKKLFITRDTNFFTDPTSMRGNKSPAMQVISKIIIQKIIFFLTSSLVYIIVKA